MSGLQSGEFTSVTVVLLNDGRSIYRRARSGLMIGLLFLSCGIVSRFSWKLMENVSNTRSTVLTFNERKTRSDRMPKY